MEDQYKYNKASAQWQAWEEQPQGQGWDEPDNALWDRIEGALPAKRQRNRWWFLLLLIPILGGIGWWGYSGEARGTRNEVRKDRNQVSGVRDQEIANNPINTETTKLVPRPSSLVPNNQESGFRDQTGPIAEIQHSKFSKDQATADKQGGKEIIADLIPHPSSLVPNNQESGIRDQVVVAQFEPNEVRGSGIEVRGADQKIAQNKKQAVVAPLTTHYLPLTSSNKGEPRYEARESTKLAPRPSSPPGEMSAGQRGPLLAPKIFLSASYTSLHPQAKVTNLTPTAPIRAREQSVNSNEWGLQVGYRIDKHWSVRTGVSHYQLAVQQQQAFRRVFDRMQELPTSDGTFKSSYAVTVNGKYGQTDMEVDFIRAANEQIADGTPLFLVVATRQQLNMVHVPLLVEYQQQFGSFYWSVQTGPSLSILQGQQQQVSASPRVLRANNLRIRNLVERTELSKTTLDWQLGTEVRYALTPALSVYVNPQYRMGLQDLSTTEVQRTRVHSFGVGVGLRVDF